MKLVQFFVPDLGARVGVLEGDTVVDITRPKEGLASTVEVLEKAEEEGGELEAFLKRVLWGVKRRKTYRYHDLDVPPRPDTSHLLLPLHPPEVWGAGITYKRSAEFRDHDTGREKGIYDYVYESERPELFFKATAARCTGPNDFIGIRSDSKLTAAEPEVAFVVGKEGRILGFTLCNDVSAWDIERENPLFLPQSKIFSGCCALGPVLVTPAQLGDPYHLTLTCRIIREGRVLFEGTVSTSQMKRTFEELARFLCRDNVIPVGTTVTTGTGIMVPNEFALADGDLVEIEAEGIGKLVNRAKRLGKGEAG